MLDKIKELLGEELASKVTEALGNVELAIMNDGSVVKADKYESLKAEHKSLTEKYQQDISDVNNKLEDAMKGAADYDTLKGTLEALQAENVKIAQEHEQELINVKKRSAVDVALLEANIDKEYIDMAKSQLNIEPLSFEGDELVGLTDSIAAMREKFPKLFGEVKKMGITPENHLNPQVGKKAQLIEKYNQAEKSGNAKLMMSIAQQIKAVKE